LCRPSTAAAAAAAAAGEQAPAEDDDDDDEGVEDAAEEWQPAGSGPGSEGEGEESSEEGSRRAARHLTKSSRYSLQEQHGPAIHHVTGGHLMAAVWAEAGGQASAVWVGELTAGQLERLWALSAADCACHAARPTGLLDSR